MQTLALRPVHNLEIVGGKFLAVWCISLISSLANAASLGATIARAAGSSDMLKPAGLVLRAGAAVAVAGHLHHHFFLPRDRHDGARRKDAGNFLGATLTLLMMPMMAALMPGVDLNAWTSFVPLVNISLLIKAFSWVKPNPT